MPNDSSTGGALTPSISPAPLLDEALVNFIHDWIAMITGLPAANILPRWQPEPPNLPQRGEDWAAFGIMDRDADTFAAELHKVEAGVGYDQIRRHEELHCLISFYGDHADSYAHLLREGMQVAQNREVLSVNNMGLIESGKLTTVPEMVKERWLYRVDLPFSLRRQIVRNYSVLNLQSALISLNNEHYSVPIVPTVP